MGYTDNGQVYDLRETRLLVEQGYQMLANLVNNTPDEDWLAPVDTPFFGTISKARMFAHVLFHTAHHSGQISLTLARGSKME
jgi:hypothetical protein